jgi:Zn-dependent protease with chaperone function
MLLLSLSLTVGFLCWWATAALSAVLWLRLRRRVSALPSTSAADYLFMLQLLPLLVSSAVVALFVVPGFVAWEPSHTAEKINVWLAVPSFISIAIFCRSLWVLWHELNCKPDVPPNIPFVAVLGCVRPMVLVTDAARILLNQEELAAVLRHERTHISRRDNVRLLVSRLVALLTLDLKPWREMEEVRSRTAEFVADESAARDEAGAVDLAQALLKMARSPFASYRFASSFASAKSVVEQRVLRLLNNPRSSRKSVTQWSIPLALGTLLCLGLLLALRHDVQYFCYQSLEKLVSL